MKRRHRSMRRLAEADLEREIQKAMAAAEARAREEELQRALIEAGAPPPKKRTGRKRIQIDWRHVQALIERGHTDGEVASLLGVSKHVFAGNHGEKRRRRDPHVEYNLFIYRGLKSLFALRAAASLRNFWFQLYRGYLNDVDETGKPIRIPVSLQWRVHAAQFLSQRPEYLGLPDGKTPAALPAVSEEASDGEGVVTVVIKDKSVLEGPKPIDITPIRSTIIIRSSGAA